MADAVLGLMQTGGCLVAALLIGWSSLAGEIAAQSKSVHLTVKITAEHPPLPIDGIVVLPLMSGATVRLRAIDIDYDRTAPQKNRVVIVADTARTMTDPASGRAYVNLTFGSQFVATVWEVDVVPDVTPGGTLAQQPTGLREDTVFVVMGPQATGLYHAKDCPSLHDVPTQVLILHEAKDRYFQPHCLCVVGREAGSSCDTTVPATAQTPPPAAVPAGTAAIRSTPAVSSARTQCAAMTKKGVRCSRMAQPGRAYCWQHP